MFKAYSLRSLFLTAALLVLASSLFAQGTTSLRGTVVDTQKAAVPNVLIRLIQKDTGLTRTTMSQANGDYQFSQLPPGAYAMTAELSGFAVTKVEAVQLLVDTPSTMDVTMEVASSSQSVNVTEQAPQLNTTNATLGNPFQQKQIQNLPLQTRNVVELLSIQPGVTQSGEAMGARRDQNNVTLDGVDSNDNQNALSGLNGTSQNAGFNSALPVPLDSVMEFRVTVAGQDASQGRSSGGQVSLVTRSGTNELHGSAYEYNRNTAFAANSWFNNRSGVDRAQLIRNQFGASLGGPVKKDRIFYFLNYERRIDASQVNETRYVPSETLKQGIVQAQLDNGNIATLTPTQITQIDPNHAGISQTTLNILRQYPAGNNPSYGSDGGLNFSGLTFNAPDKLDSRVYVGKFDWLVDSQGKHTVSFRGTLSNNNQTFIPAQFPGQSDASTLFSDNRGFSARYTALVTPSLVNVATVGLTRIGLSTSGTAGPGLVLGGIDSLLNYNSTARPTDRISPTWNLEDDLTWTKGTHTIGVGGNIRLINNQTSSFANSWPTYRFSRGILVGLGNDINDAAAPYLGGSASNPVALTNAMGDLLGLIDSLNVTYYYDKSGNAIPIGSPQAYKFITRNYEGYVQDTWKARKNLTLTFGVRYSNDTPPYEASGLQVGSTPGIDQYFANRVYAQANGIPGNQLPNGDRLSYSLNGPVNGQSSWFKRDTNNFAPRFSIAYSPTDKTVIRAGYSMVYDQYGNDLASNIGSLGSVGLATSLGFPSSYNFISSPRYLGGLPALTPAPQGGFPYTPGNVTGISGTLYGISPDLVAPYSHLVNFTVSHQFKDNLGIDVSYIGRFSRKLLTQQDTLSPLIYFKDPKSGQTWVQTDTNMRVLANNGLTAAQVQANPSLVPTSQFVENMFPGLANKYIPGSATANYFYGIYGVNSGSDLDNLHQLDRAGAGSPNGCVTVTGCYTFFAPQGSSDPTWTNSGDATYHGLAITLRRSLSHGLAFDVNYTWSHSIDNASAPTDNAGQFGGVIQNAFMPGQSRASSDFDIRHQLSANVTYDLPFGKGRSYLNSSRTWLDEIIGGWRVSSLIRVQSGLPAIIDGSGIFPTNYWQEAIAIPNGPSPKTGVYYNENGNPSLFQSTNAVNAYQDEFPGQSGMRDIVRLPGVKNVDIAVVKEFALPWEGHHLQFRAEAFNAFNFVNFNYSNVSGIGNNTDSVTGQYSNTLNNLSLQNPATFGEFTGTTEPRSLQLSLRYTF